MLDVGEWTGHVGDVWAEEWRRTDRSLADLGTHLNAAILAALPDGRGTVADIGCGAGATTIAVATARSDIGVVGFDLSSALVAIARERTVTLPDVSFASGPVEKEISSFAGFDLVMSRHGVMFFENPVDAIGRIRAATKRGGTLIFSCFREVARNAWASEMIAAIDGTSPFFGDGYVPGPFAFADPDFVSATLQAAGWTDVNMRSVPFIYRAGAGADPIDDAVYFLCRIGPGARALRSADPDERPRIVKAIRDVCARHLLGNAVDFPATAWIWTARNRCV